MADSNTPPDQHSGDLRAAARDDTVRAERTREAPQPPAPSHFTARSKPPRRRTRTGQIAFIGFVSILAVVAVVKVAGTLMGTGSRPQTIPTGPRETVGLTASRSVTVPSGISVVGSTRGPDESLWFSLTSAGYKGRLVEIDASGRMTVHGPLEAFSDGYNAMAVDGAGNVWLANSGRAPGLWRFDGTEQVRYPGADEDYGSALVVTAGPDGSIWAVTESGSLLHHAGGAWEEYRGASSGFTCHDKPVGDPMAWKCVTAVAVDAAGVVWIGIDELGASAPWVLRFDGSWTALTRAESPLTGNVQDIVSSPDGTVWILFGWELTLNQKPSDYCRTHVDISTGLLAGLDTCAGGLAAWDGRDWTIVDNWIDSPENLSLTESGTLIVLHSTQGRTAVRPVRAPGVTDYALDAPDPYYRDAGVAVGSSVWVATEGRNGGIDIRKYDLPGA